LVAGFQQQYGLIKLGVWWKQPAVSAEICSRKRERISEAMTLIAGALYSLRFFKVVDCEQVFEGLVSTFLTRWHALVVSTFFDQMT
jgi:hypothetical protein